MLSKEDKEIYEQIKHGVVPFVKLVHNPFVTHQTKNSRGEIVSSHTIPMGTTCVKSLKELLSNRYPDEIIYIYPLNDETPYQRSEHYDAVNPHNFEISTLAKHIIRTAKAKIGPIEIKEEYNREKENVIKKSITDRRLLLLTLK